MSFLFQFYTTKNGDCSFLSNNSDSNTTKLCLKIQTSQTTLRTPQYLDVTLFNENLTNIQIHKSILHAGPDWQGIVFFDLMIFNYTLSYKEAQTIVEYFQRSLKPFTFPGYDGNNQRYCEQYGKYLGIKTLSLTNHRCSVGVSDDAGKQSSLPDGCFQSTSSKSGEIRKVQNCLKCQQGGFFLKKGFQNISRCTGYCPQSYKQTSVQYNYFSYYQTLYNNNYYNYYYDRSGNIYKPSNEYYSPTYSQYYTQFKPICNQCVQGCSQCKTQPDICTKCQPGYFLTIDKKCKPTLTNEGYYSKDIYYYSSIQQQTRLFKCISGCKNCTGPSMQECQQYYMYNIKTKKTEENFTTSQIFVVYVLFILLIPMFVIFYWRRVSENLTKKWARMFYPLHQGQGYQQQQQQLQNFQDFYKDNYQKLYFFSKKSKGQSKCRLFAIALLSGDLTFPLLNPDFSYFKSISAMLVAIRGLIFLHLNLIIIKYMGPNFSGVNVLTILLFFPYPFVYKIFAERSSKGKQMLSYGNYFYLKRVRQNREATQNNLNLPQNQNTRNFQYSYLKINIRPSYKVLFFIIGGIISFILFLLILITDDPTRGRVDIINILILYYASYFGANFIWAFVNLICVKNCRKRIPDWRVEMIVHDVYEDY